MLEFPVVVAVPSGVPAKLVEYLSSSSVRAALVAGLEVPARRDHHYLVRDIYHDRMAKVKVSLVQVASIGQEKGHSHNAQVLLIWVRGSGSVYLDGVPVAMAAGNACYIPSGCVHYVEAVADAWFVTVANPPIYDDATGHLDYVEIEHDK